MSRRTGVSRIGLALAGGGFLGAAYEVGTLVALEESIDKLALNQLSAYVGVSAGSFLAAGLANGLTPMALARMYVDGADPEVYFDPAELMRPAWHEWRQAALELPGALAQAASALAGMERGGARRATWKALEAFGNALPTGIFRADRARQKLACLLEKPGRSNDFRELKAVLRIVATDIDSGESVEFGSPGFDEVPIATAVSASSAVPGLFAPVRIGDRHYLDGALNKTMHASVALAAGAGLVFCVNPLVPFRKPDDSSPDNQPAPHGKLGSLLSQSIRTAIRSPMTVGLEKYRVSHPDADIVLFEPRSNDAQMFNTSIFSLSRRRQLCEHAYQQTRADLRDRASELNPILRRHGLALNERAIHDGSLTLLPTESASAARRSNPLGVASIRLRHVLDDLERSLQLKQ